MSIFSEAQVHFILADFAINDAAGKLNVIGGGLSYIGSSGPGAPSSPFTTVVTCAVPAKYAGQQYAFTVELHDVTVGKIVMLPGETPGQMQALRAQQAVTVPPVQVPPGAAPPPDAMQATTMVMQFATGLPLVPGHSYEWKAQIDGQHRPGWWHRFHVLGPAVGPVFGGPANPAAIPGLGEFVDVPTEPQSEEPDNGASS